MTNAKSLSAKQFAVIEDLFEGELEEQTMLEKHKLSRKLYDKWLVDEIFTGRLDKRLVWEHRRSEFMLARYTRVAVSNLVQLTGCNKPETARKACLDMITMRSNHLASSSAAPEDNPTPQHESTILSPENAGKLLAFLAEEKNN
jgi:hypothetical protein